MQLAEVLDAASTARICADGALVAEVFAARTGIQTYLPSETAPPATFTGDQVRVYRPAEEVFSRDSLASYAAAPVTVNHPSVMVDAANWREYGVGEINGDIARDGERVRVPVIVRDASAVQKAQTTHKQLSMGYSCKLDWTPGTTPDGQAYDAIQREIRINHIALVPAARGGPELRIVDERPASKEPAMKIRIGDAEVDATNGEAVRIAVDGLNTKLTDATKQVGALSADLATANTAIQTKDGEIAALKQQLADATDPAKIAARDAARATVVDAAKALVPTIVTDGKSDAEIRKEAVIAKLGDSFKDAADAMIEGAFAALTKDAAPADPLRKALGDGVRTPVNDAAVVSTLRHARYA